MSGDQSIHEAMAEQQNRSIAGEGLKALRGGCIGFEEHAV
ncbi:hypothetical protein C4K35_3663 [Pseudomonas chlororaphis subsp. piscium]|nr:hypothetical protein C4K35_3663 [Pseudomonas chlororaphis subsp. piscium]AZC57817.1 hypothetical protein C4K34_3654 [Pseudomonas chlororaphis subsp. piscium]AZC70269.1 hypothetical protein C4K32_3609 [Pseudomonas chlororaphis subsp. piscium]AZC76534.1 hypothetical protein C4K31_3633 [Pseudomonas chlororaphis subsp. piscium]AZC82762.1 hypothetical protein C4K30_3650 [Pseudomonas chlororaphis subsp. piscium]